MKNSFVYYCNDCDKWTVTTPEETKGVCWNCKTPVKKYPLCKITDSVLQNILNSETSFRKWLKSEIGKNPCEPADINYMFKTIGDYEKCSGYKTNQAFEIGWNMARTINIVFGTKS